MEHTLLSPDLLLNTQLYEIVFPEGQLFPRGRYQLDIQPAPIICARQYP